MDLQISKARPTHTYIAAVNSWQQEFTSEEAANKWTTDIQGRFLWAAEIGLLKLVNSGDRRWGRRGFEHLGYEQDPSAKITRLTYRRIGNYVGKWMCMRDAPVHRDDKDEVFPIDLTGKIRDKRKLQRCPFPFKAADKGTWTIPSSWQVGEDGYYYTLYPDMMWPMDAEYWEPVIAVQERLL